MRRPGRASFEHDRADAGPVQLGCQPQADRAAALGSVYWQAADVGDVLTTVERIRDGKEQSWVDEWAVTADRLAQLAAANATAGHARTAAGQYLRGSLYYSLATFWADESGDPNLFASLWNKRRDAWDQAVDLG